MSDFGTTHMAGVERAANAKNVVDGRIARRG